MEYITRHCPKCKGELQVPVDLKSCICMYCGESFHPQEEDGVVVSDETGKALEAAYLKSLTELPLLLQDYETMLLSFTASQYAVSFSEYEQTGIKVLLPAQQFAGLLVGNVQIVVAEIAGSLFHLIEKDMEDKFGKKKVPKGTVIDQYRFFLTVYLIPMIRHLNYSISEPIADLLLETWLQKFPKFPFQKSDYDKILLGFKRKGLCFITTAVYETMNKPDDCYELTAFRHFRDTYMLETKERKAMVEEYYRIAPAIVTVINMDPDSGRRYHEIWEQFLQPCLKALEDNNLMECERIYSRMVIELKKKYYILAA